MTGTFQFIPHSKIAEFEANGWVVIDDLADCHHGRHSVLMQAPEPLDKKQAGVAAE